jgi:rhodanese-related sulfurtransferase
MVWLLVAAVAVYGAVHLGRSLSDTDPRVDAGALQARLAGPQSPLVLDVRSRSEFLQGRIPGAVHIEYRDVPRRIEEIKRKADREVVVYCETGVRARVARDSLREAGLDQIFQLRGDMQDWRRLGLPVERGQPVAG